ncbi:MAG TPA: nucleotide exchange factor GrpE [Ktedonobacterales bacterium]|nr:nucleotide exchange factor GrpE [Ktedonobacterales bacterium]
MMEEERTTPAQNEATPPGAASDDGERETPDESAGRVAELEARVAELERSLTGEREAANDYMQRWQRAQADFANFRRRAQQEQEQRELLATGKAFAGVFTALDSFERAFQTLPPSLRYFSWMDGVALIEMQLRRTLDMHEVKPVEAAPGAPFDPLRHESIGAVETAAHPDGAIAAVVQAGYELRGFILRPALVQLAKAPASTNAEVADAEPVSTAPDSDDSAIASASDAEKSENPATPATSATAGAGSRSTSEGS